MHDFGRYDNHKRLPFQKYPGASILHQWSSVLVPVPISIILHHVFPVDNTGKVTAVGTGQAVITATTKDGSFTASCTVTVATKPLYKLTPVEDDVYTIGTSDGRSTMTVNAGQSGFKSFAVSVEPDISHKGNETVIFTHWRGGTELQLNATVADFDVANTAQAGFNVQAGDVIKAYIVDRLTNDSNINPVVFQ
jgi:hypothetical protein